VTQPIDLRVLSSDELSIAVAPDLGGRIVELTDLSSGRQWLWRNHRVPLGPVTSGSAYDDVWQGGFEELFPSDAPAVIGKTPYPDHGELWSVPWQVVRADDDAIELAVEGSVTGVRFAKRLSIEGAVMTIQYSLEHPGRVALPYLFKLHPAIDVNEHCRIDLPSGAVEKGRFSVWESAG
jgi:galactose mutarotase-like enzyme